MPEIQDLMQAHLDALVRTGAETGVQVAAYQDGALIVDAVEERRHTVGRYRHGARPGCDVRRRSAGQARRFGAVAGTVRARVRQISGRYKEKILPSHTAGDSTPPQTSLGPFSSAGASPTPWEATEWALRRIQKFQLCTVRADGRPHVTPVLAIWALGAMWLTTGDNEQKAKNLSANPHCALTAGADTLTDTDYVIEGTATLVTDQATREAVATAFEQAYGWQLTRDDGTWYQLGDAVRSGNVQLYRVQPDKAFAFANGRESSQTRYRWR